MSLHETISRIRLPFSKREQIDPFDPTLTLEQVGKLPPKQQIINGIAFDLAQQGKDPHKHKVEVIHQAEEALQGEQRFSLNIKDRS